MGTATQDLRDEHESILHVLKILDQKLVPGSTSDEELIQFGNELVYFLRIFADKCHHGKEEDFLFKELEQRGVPTEGGPIGGMLHDHQLGREYIAQMDKALKDKDVQGFKEAAGIYRDLLKDHIFKENNILFVLADKLLDETDQEILFEHFTDHEENVIGHGIHEQLHAMIHQWEAG